MLISCSSREATVPEVEKEVKDAEPSGDEEETEKSTNGDAAENGDANEKEDEEEEKEKKEEKDSTGKTRAFCYLEFQKDVLLVHFAWENSDMHCETLHLNYMQHILGQHFGSEVAVFMWW